MGVPREYAMPGFSRTGSPSAKNVGDVFDPKALAVAVSLLEAAESQTFCTIGLIGLCGARNYCPIGLQGSGAATRNRSVSSRRGACRSGLQLKASASSARDRTPQAARSG